MLLGFPKYFHSKYKGFKTQYFQVNKNLLPSLAGFRWDNLRRSLWDQPLLCLYFVTAKARAMPFFPLYQSATAFLRARPHMPHFMPSFRSFLNWMKVKRWVGTQHTSGTALNAACFVLASEHCEQTASAKSRGSCFAALPSRLNAFISSTTSQPLPSSISLSKASACSKPSFCSLTW